MPVTEQYSSDLFTLIQLSALSQQYFELHPIWSEHFEYQERNEIISWGVDPQWLESELKRVHTGNDHCAYTILRPYPLPDRMRIYIHASITTKCGETFHGYVMNEEVEVLSIFANGQEFTFSNNGILSDLNERELKRLTSIIGCSPNDVFPATFKTDFLDSEDNLIEGVFALPENG